MNLKFELIGKEINGFRVTDCIGEGGMALIFRAENCVDPTIVRALKIVRPEFMERELFFKRFAREARLLEQMKHPHLINFHGLRKARGLLVMELEYLEGQNLADPPFDSEPTPLEHVLIWMTQAAEAIGIAHKQNIVHRDIKPANLFLTHEGSLKVLDFGIAKVVDSLDEEKEGTLNGHVLGSPAYMAPEVCQGEKPTPRADIYALGLIFYHLLMGRHPLVGPQMTQRTTMQMMLTHLHHTPPPLNQIIASPPKGLEAVLRRAVAREPSERYSSGDHFASALAPFLRGETSEKKLSGLISPLPISNSGASLVDQPKMLITQERGALPVKRWIKRLLFVALLLSFAGVMLFADELSKVTYRGHSIDQLISQVDDWLNQPPAPLPVAIDPKVTHELSWIEISVDSSSHISPFSMTRSEVTVAQYERCVKAKVCEPPKASPRGAYGVCSWWLAFGDETKEADTTDPPASSHLALPMNCVSRIEAQTFAQWAGGRLPTIEEWRCAASGGNQLPITQKSQSKDLEMPLYPWGSQTPTCKLAVMYEQSPSCDGAKRPHPVCSRPLGLSQDGVCDLAGNVWEWTLGGTKTHATILGGGWYSGADLLRVNTSRTRPETKIDTSVGFRVIR